MNVKTKKIRKSFLLTLLFLLCALFASCGGCSGCNGAGKSETLSLSATELHLIVGEDYALRSTVTGATWSSEDANVARVDGKGRVAAVGVGTTKITAKYGDQRVECSVHVTQATTVSTYSVSFADTQATLRVGESITLQTQTYTNGENTGEIPAFESENASVATVSETGEIRALSTGKTTIRATYRTATAVCAVYVVEDETLFFLSDVEISLKLGESKTLTATLKQGAETVSTDVTWQVSNGSVSVSSDGTVTGVNGGNAVVTATTSEGASAYCQVRVYREKEINSLAEFLAIEDDPFVEYSLGADIDFSGYAWTEKTVIARLSSPLDGRGHKLYNIKRDVAGDYTAFFGELATTAELKNLAIYIDNYAFNAKCGVLALTNRGTVQDCYIRYAAKGNSSTYTTLLCCGLVVDNYGVMQNLLVDMDVKVGSTRHARFHALAARNGGAINDCVVISSATTSVNVTIDGVKVAHVLYQLLSGSNESATNTPYGYLNDAAVSNAYDVARGDCLLFENVENLLRFGNGGYAINDRAPLVLPTETDALKITESSVLSRFNGEIWSFANGVVKFCNATLYGA